MIFFIHNSYHVSSKLYQCLTGASAKRSTVTADVEFDPTDACPEPVVNVVKEPDTLELVDTVESSV